MAGEQTTHAASLDLADGRHIRFGPDEADVGRVPTQVDLGTELPGGFGPADLTLTRPDQLSALDAPLFAGGRIYHAASNMTFYEGRITGTPQVGANEIELQFEGWGKHLGDDETARFVGYDRDPSNWQGMSVQRKLNFLATPFHIEDGQVVPDPTTGAQAIETSLTDPWSDGGARAEMWYDAGPGLSLGGLDGAWKQLAANVANGDWNAALSDDDLATTLDSSGSLKAAGPASFTVAATGTRRFARLQFLWSAAITATSGKKYSVYWTLVGVVGDHGLTLQGSLATPNTGRGLLGSDLEAYIVGRWAPLLTFTTGSSGSIEPTSFVIPHIVFRDPVTAVDMLDALALLGGNTSYPMDYGVYENRQFFMRSPGNGGRTWRVRRDQASEPSDDGPDAQTRLNGVLVTYDDGTGTQHSVGPPGSSAELEDASLADTDTSNPANQDGARHWKHYEAGITSQAGALLLGQIILADANRDEWRGSITIKGQATDSSGNIYPAAMVRAGDTIIVEDDRDTNPRRVVETSYSGADNTVQASCGAKPDRLDSLLARLGVVIQGKL